WSQQHHIQINAGPVMPHQAPIPLPVGQNLQLQPQDMDISSTTPPPPPPLVVSPTLPTPETVPAAAGAPISTPHVVPPPGSTTTLRPPPQGIRACDSLLPVRPGAAPSLYGFKHRTPCAQNRLLLMNYVDVVELDEQKAASEQDTPFGWCEEMMLNAHFEWAWDLLGGLFGIDFCPLLREEAVMEQELQEQEPQPKQEQQLHQGQPAEASGRDSSSNSSSTTLLTRRPAGKRESLTRVKLAYNLRLLT
ncbi:unnamed protein product, partial [Amoebophrya sp. A25]